MTPTTIAAGPKAEQTLVPFFNVKFLTNSPLFLSAICAYTPSFPETKRYVPFFSPFNISGGISNTYSPLFIISMTVPLVTIAPFKCLTIFSEKCNSFTFSTNWFFGTLIPACIISILRPSIIFKNIIPLNEK